MLWDGMGKTFAYATLAACVWIAVAVWFNSIVSSGTAEKEELERQLAVCKQERLEAVQKYNSTRWREY